MSKRTIEAPAPTRAGPAQVRSNQPAPPSPFQPLPKELPPEVERKIAEAVKFLQRNPAMLRIGIGVIVGVGIASVFDLPWLAGAVVGGMVMQKLNAKL